MYTQRNEAKEQAKQVQTKKKALQNNLKDTVERSLCIYQLKKGILESFKQKRLREEGIQTKKMKIQKLHEEWQIERKHGEKLV